MTRWGPKILSQKLTLWKKCVFSFTTPRHASFHCQSLRHSFQYNLERSRSCSITYQSADVSRSADPTAQKIFHTAGSLSFFFTSSTTEQFSWTALGLLSCVQVSFYIHGFPQWLSHLLISSFTKNNQTGFKTFQVLNWSTRPDETQRVLPWFRWLVFQSNHRFIWLALTMWCQVVFLWRLFSGALCCLYRWNPNTPSMFR